MGNANDPEAVYTPAELREMIQNMRTVATQFYAGAVRVGNHPFIEFTGLMNEYIKLCEDAVAQGIDFTQATAHTGGALPMAPHHANYLGEKLGCIYGPALQDPTLRRVFLGTLLGKDVESLPEESA